MVTTVSDYILGFPPEVRRKLTELRTIIARAAPDAEEKISYQMPTYCLNGNLVHFAAYKKHIGFYPTPSGIAAFAGELQPYKTSKGAVQFPVDQPLPVEVIEKIVIFRRTENLLKAKGKGKGRTSGI